MSTPSLGGWRTDIPCTNFVGLADPAECRQTDALRDRTLAEGQKKTTEKSKGTGRSSSFTECIRKRANKLTIDRTVRGLLAVRYRHKVQAQPKPLNINIKAQWPEYGIRSSSMGCRCRQSNGPGEPKGAGRKQQPQDGAANRAGHSGRSGVLEMALEMVCCLYCNYTSVQT